MLFTPNSATTISQQTAKLISVLPIFSCQIPIVVSFYCSYLSKRASGMACCWFSPFASKFFCITPIVKSSHLNNCCLSTSLNSSVHSPTTPFKQRISAHRIILPHPKLPKSLFFPILIDAMIFNRSP